MDEKTCDACHDRRNSRENSMLDLNTVYEERRFSEPKEKEAKETSNCQQGGENDHKAMIADPQILEAVEQNQEEKSISQEETPVQNPRADKKTPDLNPPPASRIYEPQQQAAPWANYSCPSCASLSETVTELHRDLRESRRVSEGLTEGVANQSRRIASLHAELRRQEEARQRADWERVEALQDTDKLRGELHVAQTELGMAHAHFAESLSSFMSLTQGMLDCPLGSASWHNLRDLMYRRIAEEKRCLWSPAKQRPSQEPPQKSRKRRTFPGSNLESPPQEQEPLVNVEPPPVNSPVAQNFLWGGQPASVPANDEPVPDLSLGLGGPQQAALESGGKVHPETAPLATTSTLNPPLQAENEPSEQQDKKVNLRGKRKCPICSALIAAASADCSHCGHIFRPSKWNKHRSELGMGLSRKSSGQCPPPLFAHTLTSPAMPPVQVLGNQLEPSPPPQENSSHWLNLGPPVVHNFMPAGPPSNGMFPHQHDPHGA